MTETIKVIYEGGRGVRDRERYLARQRRYNKSEKGRARWLRYRLSGKGAEADRRQYWRRRDEGIPWTRPKKSR